MFAFVIQHVTLFYIAVYPSLQHLGIVFLRLAGVILSSDLDAQAKSTSHWNIIAEVLTLLSLSLTCDLGQNGR